MSRHWIIRVGHDKTTLTTIIFVQAAIVSMPLVTSSCRKRIDVAKPILPRYVVLQHVWFVEEGVDFLADDGMLGYLAELFILA